ncbi:MAG: hypothetical protein LH649_02045, partial [Pseudanabaena sp. CAN_BIN31]|nr:hypothetical protein [Pseudanabaena sp. CAN_BIN31]
FKGKNPVVTLIEKVYNTGVKLTMQPWQKLKNSLSVYPIFKNGLLRFAANQPKLWDLLFLGSLLDVYFAMSLSVMIGF